MPGYVDANDPTDQAVLTWLNDTESLALHIDPAKRWLDVPFHDFELWVARQNLFGSIHEAAETTPFNDNSGSARMMDLILISGQSRLLSSNADVRAILDNGTQPPGSNFMTAAARADLDLLAQPNVTRWHNADWTVQPGLGDVQNARALP